MSDAEMELRNRNRAVWAAGNWDVMAELVSGMGPDLLDVVGIEPGMDVLDVATGSGGNVAIPAARRGAKVTGCDLVPEHFTHARRRAAEAGVEVEWVEADAERLPFDDAGFDRVLSTFGHMFAPNQERAAAELARVCRPGGTIGFCTWTPEGFVGSFFTTLGSFLPPPPPQAGNPLGWGREQRVRELLEPHGCRLEFRRGTVALEKPDTETFMAFYEQNFGPVVTAKGALGDIWPKLRGELVTMFEQWNRATDGSLHVDAEYLLTVARREA